MPTTSPERSSRPEAAPAPAATLRPGTLIPLLAAVVLALTFLMYFPTLGSSWAYDDIDYINQAADTMSGRQGFLDLLLRPQGEHVVAGFRIVQYASLKLCGVAAFPFRLLVLIAHATSAFFLGLLAWRYSRSAAAALAAGVTYAGACGFSSMWIWLPAGATVPFAMAALTGGLVALAWRQRLGIGRARLLAGAAVVAALLTESTLAPLAVLPLLLDEYERRREGARRPLGLFSVFCLLTAAAVAVLVSVLYTRTFGPHMNVSLRHGVPRSIYLLLVAPFRLFFPGVPVLASDPGLQTAVLGSLLGLAVAAPLGALLLTLWRRGAPRLATLAALTLVGPLGVIGLVGLGRWRNSYRELYDADRYFFTLLFPLSFLAAAVADSVARHLRAWPRRTRAALLLLASLALGAELALHRSAMLGRIPFAIYQAHEDRFAQLERLAARLQAAARSPGEPPLEIPDTDLWFPNVHNGRISTRTLLYAIGRGPGPGLRLGGPTVGERDARRLNPVLAAWAREIGEPLPYLSVVQGRLVDAHVIRLADFRTGPQERAVVSGFYGWEGTSRWMGGSGELRLTLALSTPGLVFHFAVPPEALHDGAAARPITIDVSAVDEAARWSTPLGTIRVEQEGLQVYRLDATAFLSRLGNGRIVHLLLRSDRTWRPAGTIAGSTDTRDLSVQVFAAGCE